MAPSPDGQESDTSAGDVRALPTLSAAAERPIPVTMSSSALDRDGIDAVIDACAAALTNPRAAVLVGAGASAEAGLPTWSAFVESIAAKLHPDFGTAVRAFSRQERYLEAAQAARMAMGDDDLWHAHFEPFTQSGLETSLWRLVAGLGLAKMVTTNWDGVGENSFATVWSKAASLHVGVEEILTPLDDLCPHIIHPHGKAIRPQTLIFTEAQYRSVESEPRYREFWIDLLVGRPLLIVGFSGADPAFVRTLKFIKEELRILRNSRPFVLCPRGESDTDRFGVHARFLTYDNTDGSHKGASIILRKLKERLSQRRSEVNVKDDPHRRCALDLVSAATTGELTYALIGVELRSRCAPETFAALSLLLSRLASQKAVTTETLPDLLTETFRVTRLESEEMAASALEAARMYGWVEESAGNIVATASVPRPESTRWSAVVDKVVSLAQTPLSWTVSGRYLDYVKSALLAALGSQGARASRSLLGLSVGKDVTASRLQRSLSGLGHSIGDASIEGQICKATLEVLDSPPPELAEACGRLANFALVHDLVGLSAGRELIRELAPIEALYLDTNIALPAVAPGHPWNRACFGLVNRARRSMVRLLITEGFLEEFRLQMNDAAMLSEKTAPEELMGVVLGEGRGNGFLQAYEVWQRDRSATFSEYRAAVGLLQPEARLESLGVQVVRAPREWGPHAEVYARVSSGLGNGGRREKLARHEAEQIALLAKENSGRRGWPVRFVTAHHQLRAFTIREHLREAAAVSPPIALAHLLSAISHADLPPASLRELAFDGSAPAVAELLFAVLLSRWRTDPARLQRIGEADVVERIRSELRRLNERFDQVDTVDSRRELMRFLEDSIAPALEEAITPALAANASALVLPTRTGDVVDDARRLAAKVTSTR